MESTASGWVAGVATAMDVLGKPMPTLDRLTATGALATYISDHTVAKFQPMNVNFGIIEPLGYKIKGKREKNTKISERALEQIETEGRALIWGSSLMRWAAITRPNPLYGAVRWLRRNTAEVLLVGKPEVVANVTQGKGLSDVKGITIMPANDLVDMHDDPQRYSAASRIRPWR